MSMEHGVTSRAAVVCRMYIVLVRDSLGWLVEFIAKFLQFQPEVQQEFSIANVSTTVL